MLRKLFLFSTLLFAYGCHHTQTANDTRYKDSLLDTGVFSHDTALFQLSEKNWINKPILDYITGRILFPNTSYRVSEHDEISKILADGEWLEIFKNQSGYLIAPSKYSIHNEDEEPCSGLPTQSIETNRNSLLLFQIPNIKVGKLDSIPLPKRILAPNDVLEFSFNEHKYTLHAEGINPLKHDYRDTPNAYYSLTLSTADSNTDILYQNSYNDTVTEILFIGDIDKDGRPDFILSSPRDYEEERIIIYLSKENKHYEGTRQFDC